MRKLNRDRLQEGLPVLAAYLFGALQGAYIGLVFHLGLFTIFVGAAFGFLVLSPWFSDKLQRSPAIAGVGCVLSLAALIKVAVLQSDRHIYALITIFIVCVFGVILVALASESG
jgi:hypothetical protein